MTVQIPDLISQARLRLNLGDEAPPLFPEGAPVAYVDRLLESLVPQAVRAVVEQCPIEMLAPTGRDFSDEGIYWDEDDCVDGFCGHVLLPCDFHRLISFRMSDWTTAVSAVTPRRAALTSRYAGIRGSSERPVCTLRLLPEGTALAFSSCRSRSAEIAEASYYPYPAIDANHGIEIPDKAFDLVIDEIAARFTRIMNTNPPN